MPENITAMIGEFSSREIASLVWGSLLLFFVLRNKVLREGLLAVFTVIFSRPIIKWSSLMCAYVCATCYLFNLLGVWSLHDFKATFLWLISAGLYMVYQAVKETPSPSDLIGGIFRNGFNIAVILEFFVSNYTFSIFIELIIVSVAFFLVFISSPSKTDDPRAQLAVNFANSALSWVGLFLLLRDFEPFGPIELFGGDFGRGASCDDHDLAIGKAFKTCDAWDQKERLASWC